MSKKDDKVLICPNPLVTSTGGMSADAGNLMPSAIHGGIAMENSDAMIFKSNIPQSEIDDLLQTSNIENSRFDIEQFIKYYGQTDIEWCALFSESNECLSIAALQPNHPYSGYVYIDEIQALKKGFGLPLLKKIVEKYKKVWLMANTAAGDTLVDYYRDTGLFEEIEIPDSVYECPAYFFCTKECDYGKLEGYCNAFYANDKGDDVYDESTCNDLKKESSIDYPVSSGLCPDIWECNGDAYVIHGDIKQRALELVDVLLAKYHVEAKGVNVVGSICSNQYTDDADVDIHIQVDLPEEVANALNKLRKLEQDKVLGGVDLMVGDNHTHPLEFYFQSNVYADMGSCGCYDLMNDTWLSGPQLVSLEFDPFEEYEESWSEAFDYGSRAQTALFDLHKNLYKYSAILEQASNREVYSDEQMMSVIGRRLEEVKDELLDSMQVVADLKEEMVQVRKRAGLKPTSPEEAESMRTNRDWLVANSTFKFLQRLDVLDDVWLAAELHNAVEIGDMTVDEAIRELNAV